mgnify:CR=1 FL=1
MSHVPHEEDENGIPILSTQNRAPLGALSPKLANTSIVTAISPRSLGAKRLSLNATKPAPLKPLGAGGAVAKITLLTPKPSTLSSTTTVPVPVSAPAAAPAAPKLAVAESSSLSGMLPPPPRVVRYVPAQNDNNDDDDKDDYANDDYDNNSKQTTTAAPAPVFAAPATPIRGAPPSAAAAAAEAATAVKRPAPATPSVALALLARAGRTVAGSTPAKSSTLNTNTSSNSSVGGVYSSDSTAANATLASASAVAAPTPSRMPATATLLSVARSAAAAKDWTRALGYLHRLIPAAAYTHTSSTATASAGVSAAVAGNAEIWALIARAHSGAGRQAEALAAVKAGVAVGAEPESVLAAVQRELMTSVLGINAAVVASANKTGLSAEAEEQAAKASIAYMRQQARSHNTLSSASISVNTAVNTASASAASPASAAAAAVVVSAVSAKQGTPSRAELLQRSAKLVRRARRMVNNDGDAGSDSEGGSDDNSAVLSKGRVVSTLNMGSRFEGRLNLSDIDDSFDETTTAKATAVPAAAAAAAVASVSAPVVAAPAAHVPGPVEAAAPAANGITAAPIKLILTPAPVAAAESTNTATNVGVRNSSAASEMCDNNHLHAPDGAAHGHSPAHGPFNGPIETPLLFKPHARGPGFDAIQYLPSLPRVSVPYSPAMASLPPSAASTPSYSLTLSPSQSDSQSQAHSQSSRSPASSVSVSGPSSRRQSRAVKRLSMSSAVSDGDNNDDIAVDDIDNDWDNGGSDAETVSPRIKRSSSGNGNSNNNASATGTGAAAQSQGGGSVYGGDPNDPELLELLRLTLDHDAGDDSNHAAKPPAAAAKAISSTTKAKSLRRLSDQSAFALSFNANISSSNNGIASNASGVVGCAKKAAARRTSTGASHTRAAMHDDDDDDDFDHSLADVNFDAPTLTTSLSAMPVKPQTHLSSQPLIAPSFTAQASGSSTASTGSSRFGASISGYDASSNPLIASAKKSPARARMPQNNGSSGGAYSGAYASVTSAVTSTSAAAAPSASAVNAHSSSRYATSAGRAGDREQPPHEYASYNFSAADAIAAAMAAVAAMPTPPKGGRKGGAKTAVAKNKPAASAKSSGDNAESSAVAAAATAAAVAAAVASPARRVPVRGGGLERRLANDLAQLHSNPSASTDVSANNASANASANAAAAEGASVVVVEQSRATVSQRKALGSEFVLSPVRRSKRNLTAYNSNADEASSSAGASAGGESMFATLGRTTVHSRIHHGSHAPLTATAATANSINSSIGGSFVPTKSSSNKGMSWVPAVEEATVALMLSKPHAFSFVPNPALHGSTAVALGNRMTQALAPAPNNTSSSSNSSSSPSASASASVSASNGTPSRVRVGARTAAPHARSASNVSNSTQADTESAAAPVVSKTAAAATSASVKPSVSIKRAATATASVGGVMRLPVGPTAAAAAAAATNSNTASAAVNVVAAAGARATRTTRASANTDVSAAVGNDEIVVAAKRPATRQQRKA